MSLSMGVQLYSVKNALHDDFYGTLEKVADIGYKYLELVIRETEDGLSFGGNSTPAGLKKALERLGIKAVGCHTRVDKTTNWDGIIAANKEIGNTKIGCSIAFFSNKQDVLEFCDMFNEAGRICKENGMQLYYHNHFQEFQVFEEEIIMDLMIQNMDEDLVKFEFDTYWAVRGGVDPIHWLNKLGDRCIMIHQKDLPHSVNPVNWFDFFGADSILTIDELYQTQDPDHFTEIGNGSLDIPKIIEAARNLNHIEYIFVEQDATSRDELEGISISYENLKRMLE